MDLRQVVLCALAQRYREEWSLGATLARVIYDWKSVTTRSAAKKPATQVVTEKLERLDAATKDALNNTRNND